MVAIELLVMSEMYKNTLVRNILIGVAIIATVGLVLFTRYQVAIDDEDFLRSMIPHHSGAILMCANPKLADPEIVSLCREIVESQEREIDTMKAIRTRFNQ